VKRKSETLCSCLPRRGRADLPGRFDQKRLNPQMNRRDLTRSKLWCARDRTCAPAAFGERGTWSNLFVGCYIAAASRNRSVSVWFMRCGEANREAPARAEPRPTAPASMPARAEPRPTAPASMPARTEPCPSPSGRPTGAKHLRRFSYRRKMRPSNAGTLHGFIEGHLEIIVNTVILD